MKWGEWVRSRYWVHSNRPERFGRLSSGGHFEKIEGFLLKRCGSSDALKLKVAHLDCVQRDGSQVLEQGLKTVNRQVVSSTLGASLLLGLGRALGRSNDGSA